MLTNACEIGPSERLWELESLPGKNTITNVQAAMIIAYHMSTNSLEQVGAVYAKRAREMGEKLDLFEPNYCGLGMNMNEARVFTAWALFSWQAMFSFYQSRRPYFRETPRIPLYLHRKDIYISPLGGSIVV
ncbi:uncharacterized protein SETTUDRAFT_17962 [Exserohilum turcica Et28A]|uniref:Uncharacterized protein n=1 Tax=Exserohilum turcicum (strain 28A) TaxID=671987 RepID=R0J2S5_EXST2|nr:uncharacterized protein SETTUDRAFT_17962 [Exserohilum turcica Et28A]EOA91270.1 hypothetical protein SETTUDRAFT_17962 [Exserohilum turcica Et28A]